MTGQKWNCEDCKKELSCETVCFFTDSDIPLCVECYSGPDTIDQPRSPKPEKRVPKHSYKLLSQIFNSEWDLCADTGRQ